MVANAYRGELLGLMAIHLILLSINKINCNLSGGVEIVLDCLGALKQVTSLPPYRIPSRCQHSDILKNLLVNCRNLSFTLYYSHVKVHQDDNKFFKNLSRKAQLNCICDHTAKQQIVINGEEGPTTGGMFPLKPIGVFIEGEKLTSETGDQLRFWAHLQLARIFYAKQGIMTHRQFDKIDWRSVHRTLHDLLRLFQVWAAKHDLNIAGTTKFLSYQDGQCKLCPSCQKCKETYYHVARCPEKGWAMAFDQSTNEVERWLDSNNTHPDLQQLLLQYLRGCGAVTCLECSMNLDLPYIMQDLAALQDIIGWDNFAMGMVSKKLLQIQSTHLSPCNSGCTAKKWISGFITQEEMRFCQKCKIKHSN